MRTVFSQRHIASALRVQLTLKRTRKTTNISNWIHFGKAITFDRLFETFSPIVAMDIERFLIEWVLNTWTYALFFWTYSDVSGR